tara:strand:+ start:1468 stop:2241 length:774 start_codon:yes stop_codon:yes gene_type:complete
VDIDFSIIIPTLNSEKYLRETIESLKLQDKSIKIQLIFSDGGSTDNTFNIIENLDQKNIIKMIIYKKIGLSHAINEGLDLAEGKYLSYLNSDDILDKNALINVKRIFETNQGKDWIIGLCQNIGKKKYLNNLINFYKKFFLKKLNLNILCINNVISQPSVFWRKNFYFKIGRFDESLKFNMDYDMWIRMINVSKPYILNLTVSYFRRHSDSLSYKNTFSQFKEKFKTMKKYKNNLFTKILHILISSIILIIYRVTNY